MEPFFDDSVDVVIGKLIGYGVSSVKDFLDNRGSVKTTIHPGWDRPLYLYVHNRALIYFGSVGLYRSGDSKFRVEDMTGHFECTHTPFWFPPGFRTPREIQEGRQYNAEISYNPYDKSTFLMTVDKFGPGEGEQDLERTVDGMLDLAPQQ